MTTPMQQLEILLETAKADERHAYQNYDTWKIRAEIASTHRVAIESALDKCRKEEPK